VIGGYAIVEAASRDEAIKLARRFMELHVAVSGPSYEGECEIRQLFDGSRCEEVARATSAYAEG
jgi:hypothetical protein